MKWVMAAGMNGGMSVMAADLFLHLGVVFP